MFYPGEQVSYTCNQVRTSVNWVESRFASVRVFSYQHRSKEGDELAGKMDAGPEISLSAVSATNRQTSPTIIRSYQFAVTRYSTSYLNISKSLWEIICLQWKTWHWASRRPSRTCCGATSRAWRSMATRTPAASPPGRRVLAGGRCTPSWWWPESPPWAERIFHPFGEFRWSLLPTAVCAIQSTNRPQVGGRLVYVSKLHSRWYLLLS